MRKTPQRQLRGLTSIPSSSVEDNTAAADGIAEVARIAARTEASDER